jgi:hypothetical protein
VNLSILTQSFGDDPAMGFNKLKMEDARRQEAEKEVAARRATERQILEDADHLITVWNERQAKRMPMLFSPTIGAAITAGGLSSMKLSKDRATIDRRLRPCSRNRAKGCENRRPLSR